MCDLQYNARILCAMQSVSTYSWGAITLVGCKLRATVRMCSNVSSGGSRGYMANCSDEPKPFVALSDSQQEHLVQLIIGGVNGEIQLVETARDREGCQDMRQPLTTS